MSDVREFPMKPKPQLGALSTVQRAPLADMEASEIDAFAMRLFISDCNIGHIVPSDTPFTKVDERAPISSEQRQAIRARAAMAVRLGHPIRSAVAVEKAALRIVQRITEGIRVGQIGADSPLVAIDLSMARQLAKMATEGAFDYLAGKDEM